MDFPQNILNKFLVRQDYIDLLDKEQSIFVYIDLTNVLHWQDTLKWKFRIEDLVEQLFSYKNVKEIKVYYGVNNRDLKNSEAFHTRIKKTGAILRSKPMKFIIKKIDENMFFQRKTWTLFDDGTKDKIKNLIKELESSGTIIEEPKCNFDVEMSMDILDEYDKYSSLILFSGDSDMSGPLNRIKIKGKKIVICGVRGKVAEELHSLKDKYFDFGKFYTGKKSYIKSENPAEAGPRD